MQIFINKNGEQLGPFDEAKAFEMMQTGEVSASDFIFREGDSEWASIDKFYDIEKLIIFKINIKTGLIIQYGLPPSDYQPTESLYLKVPSKTLPDFEFDYLSIFYKLYYGETWQSGNSDGSQYVVLDEDIVMLSTENSAEWREAADGKLYLAKGEKLATITHAEFEKSVNFVKMKGSEIKPSENPEPLANSIQPEIDKIDEDIRSHLAGQLVFTDLCRSFIEFQYWIVPVDQQKVLAGDPKNFTVFPTGDPDINGVCFFTSPEALANFERDTPFMVDSHLVLPGEKVFDYDFSGLYAININPPFENALMLENYTFPEINRLAKISKNDGIAPPKGKDLDKINPVFRG